MKLSLPKEAAGILSAILRGLSIRFGGRPVETVADLAHFVESRAAYIAQTSLYGYLKTRMGTRYVLVFEDEAFAKSINFAKWRVYAGCLSDLAVFAAATAAPGGLEDAEAAGLARHCFERSKDNAFVGEDMDELRAAMSEEFATRLNWINWREAAGGEHAFSVSPRELVRWAPIADELKTHDEEIVTNSIRFRWRGVREQLRKRIDAQAICAQWRRLESADRQAP